MEYILPLGLNYDKDNNKIAFNTSYYYPPTKTVGESSTDYALRVTSHYLSFY